MKTRHLKLSYKTPMKKKSKKIIQLINLALNYERKTCGVEYENKENFGPMV
jgi:hypothetical protein